MGHIVKKVLVKEDEHDGTYDILTVEINADNNVHFHIHNIRLDMSLETFWKFRKDVIDARDKLLRLRGEAIWTTDKSRS